MDIDLGRLLDALPGLVWTALPDGRAEYFGRRWLDYTGLCLDESIGHGWTSALHPDDAQCLLSAWTEITASGEPGEVETRLRRRDGEYRWHRTMVNPLCKANGSIELWCGLSTDIEDAKHVDAALKASETRLQRAYDSFAEAQRLSHTGSFITDLVADDHDWSEESYRIFDFDPSKPPSLERVRRIVHPDDLGDFDAMIAEATTGAHVDFTFRIMTERGALKHVRGLARVTERVAGRPLFIGALQDVTESKLVEEALRASEAELRRANRHLTEAQGLSKTGSFTWDVEADHHDWSHEERRIFEFDRAARITLPMILSAVHPDDMPMVERVIGQAISGDAGFELIFRIVTQSGALKHLHCVGHRIQQITDRPVFLGAAQDITERKAAEEALDRARAELAHVARFTTLSALTASIAHEVNQPLAGIITNASTCLRMLAADPPNVEGARATAQRTIRDGNRAKEVIQRLRALFAHKSGAFEPIDLNSVASDVLALSTGELQAARVVATCELARELPPVSGDRVQLQQVILNLLSNAADAMREVVDRPRTLTIGTRRDATDRIVMSVRDSGVGFEPDHLERMFDAFYTTKTQGMGVGLAISRSIIESHGGRLWAKLNQNSPGAEFGFWIPAAMDALSFGGEATRII